MITREEIEQAFHDRFNPTDETSDDEFNDIFDFIGRADRKSLTLGDEFIECPSELMIIDNVHQQLEIKLRCTTSIWFNMKHTISQATADSICQESTWINFSGTNLQEVNMQLLTSDKIGMTGCHIHSFKTLLAPIDHLKDLDLLNTVVHSFEGLPKKVDHIDMDSCVFEHGLDYFPDYVGSLSLNMATTLRPLTLMTHKIGRMRCSAKTDPWTKIVVGAHQAGKDIYGAAADLIDKGFDKAATL